MKEVTVLIVDSDRVRGASMQRVLAAMPPVRVLALTANMSEGLMRAEAMMPAAVLISSELAAQPEFEMFFALTRMIEAVCLIYGNASDFEGVSARCLPMTCDEDARRIGQLLFAGRTALAQRAPAAAAPDSERDRLIVIGASTGGITAIEEILADFPEDCPPTAIVQHIRGDFAQGFIERLDRNCRARVSPASEGAQLKTGQIYVATGNSHHLLLKGWPQPHCTLVAQDPVSGHRPSVDCLFSSAAQYGTKVTAALLTGMGRDGANGMLEIRRAGGATLAQSRETCIVFGMPRVAIEIGAAQSEVPINRVARALLSAPRPLASSPFSTSRPAFG